MTGMIAYWIDKQGGIALRSLLGMGVALAISVDSAKADLPAGFGKDTTVRVCGRCHSPERAASVHQTRGEWEGTVSKMLKIGAQGSDEELDDVVVYLSTHFGPEKPSPININKATSVDLQTTLLLRRSQAAAIIHYRSENGDFKSIDDLKNVPGLDFAAIQSKKSRVAF